MASFPRVNKKINNVQEPKMLGTCPLLQGISPLPVTLSGEKQIQESKHIFLFCLHSPYEGFCSQTKESAPPPVPSVLLLTTSQEPGHREKDESQPDLHSTVTLPLQDANSTIRTPSELSWFAPLWYLFVSALLEYSVSIYNIMFCPQASGHLFSQILFSPLCSHLLSTNVVMALNNHLQPIVAKV